MIVDLNGIKIPYPEQILLHRQFEGIENVCKYICLTYDLKISEAENRIFMSKLAYDSGEINFIQHGYELFCMQKVINNANLDKKDVEKQFLGSAIDVLLHTFNSRNSDLKLEYANSILNN